MASVQPKNCTYFTAASTARVDVLHALRQHVQNNATEWSVAYYLDDRGSSGDYGVCLEPDAESFQVNIRWDAGNSKIMMAVDGNSPISANSETLDPTAVGTSRMSPESKRKDTTNTINTKVGFGEWDDAFVVLMFDANLTYSPEWWCGGRWIQPLVLTDENNGFSGLLVTGGEPFVRNDQAFGYSPDNFDHVGLMETPDGWRKPEVPDISGTRLEGAKPQNKWNNLDGLFPMTVDCRDASDSHIYYQVATCKYLFWDDTSRGGSAIQLWDDGSGNGFMYLSHDGGSKCKLIPWDPTSLP